MNVRLTSKYAIVALFVLGLMSVSFATTAISSALVSLCSASKMFLGGAIMIMILLAGATYAIGQVLGAETRARASVWATAMMTGAIIGALIYLITPVLINTLLAGSTAGSVTVSGYC